MKILITGGFGFLGSSLIRRLLIDNHIITVIDDLSSGEEIVNKDVLFYKLTTEDLKCEKIFEDGNFDVVIHLAYKGFSQKQYIKNNDYIYSNNMGLNNILNLSLKYKVKKVVVISSFKAYGNKQSESFTEKDIPFAKSSEGHSYLTREVIATEYKNLGLNVVLIRAGAVYGPEQYGADLSYIESKDNSIGDLIYIEDFSYAISKVIMNHCDPILNLSNGEGDSNIMDSSRIRFILNWYPRVSWMEGKELSRDKIFREQINTIKNDEKSIKINALRYKDLEVGVLFIFTFFLSYIVRYKLGLNIDLFILYIVFVSIIYGLKQSLTSILLSSISFIWFSFHYENKTALTFIYDLSRILYLTQYFIIGSSIGYYIDEKRKNEDNLKEGIRQINEDIGFIEHLYEKSLEVRDNLQNTIENYDNNLSKINDIIEKLNLLPIEKVEAELPSIFIDNFYSNSVSFYTLSNDKSSLQLKTFAGESKFEKILNLKKNDYIQSTLKSKDIYVNRNIDKNKPTICVPIFYEDLLFGIVLISEIDFKYLNQAYINKLRVTSKLISNLLYQSHKCQNNSGGR